MFSGLGVQALASATARSLMLAARRQAPSHVLREQFGAGGPGLRRPGRAAAGLSPGRADEAARGLLGPLIGPTEWAAGLARPRRGVPPCSSVSMSRRWLQQPPARRCWRGEGKRPRTLCGNSSGQGGGGGGGSRAGSRGPGRAAAVLTLGQADEAASGAPGPLLGPTEHVGRRTRGPAARGPPPLLPCSSVPMSRRWLRGGNRPRVFFFCLGGRGEPDRNHFRLFTNKVAPIATTELGRIATGFSSASERLMRGFREACERLPRGCRKASGRLLRGFRGASDRLPRGLREASERGFRKASALFLSGL